MKNEKSRAIIMALAGIYLVYLGVSLILPRVVYAEEGVLYIDANGVSQTASDETVLTSGATLSSGWYVAIGTVTINSSTLEGETHLILADGATLTVSGNIDTNGQDFNIYGQAESTGALSVTNGSSIRHGIGGDGGGTITINGGSVQTKNAGSNHSALGGQGVAIVVNGGFVIATSSAAGPAIGGSGSPSFTINGGVVIATQTGTGPAIGGIGTGTITNVNINGGYLVAQAVDGYQAIKTSNTISCPKNNFSDTGSSLSYTTVLTEDLTIPEDKSWVMGGNLDTSGYDITMGYGSSLTGAGTITGSGDILCNGTIADGITINVTGSYTTNIFDLTDCTFNPTSLVYTGNSLIGSWTVNETRKIAEANFTIVSEIYDTITYTYSSEESGTYQLVSDVQEAGYYKVVYENTEDDYQIEIPIVINKKEATITVDVVDITYDGESLECVNVTDGSNSTADVTYTYDGDGDIVVTWYASEEDAKATGATSISTPTDTGTYFVKISATEGSNYSATEEAVITKVVIGAKTLTEDMISLEKQVLDYNGILQTPTIAVGDLVNDDEILTEDDYTVTYSEGSIETSLIEGGIYSAKVVGEGNYTGTVVFENYITIQSVEPTVTITANPEPSVMYGGDVDYTVTIAGITDGSVPTGSIELKNEDEVLATVDLSDNLTASYTMAQGVAGDYEITATYVPAENEGNYKTVSESLNYKITQRTPTLEVTVNSSIIYDGASLECVDATEESDLIADVTYTYDGDGKVVVSWYASEVDATSERSPLAFTPINAGVYYVKISATEGSNYTASEDAIIKEVIIEEAESSISIASIEDVEAYTGGDIIVVATITGITEGSALTGSVQFYNGEEALGNPVVVSTEEGITTATYTMNAPDVGSYNITGKFIPSEDIENDDAINYSTSESLAETFTIGIATAEISFIVVSDIVYDGACLAVNDSADDTEVTELADVTYTYTGDSVNKPIISVTWYESDGEIQMEDTEAPKIPGTYVLKVSAEATLNYQAVTEELEVTILLKSIMSSDIEIMIEDINPIYTGDAYEPSIIVVDYALVDGNMTLVEGVDYSVKYADNVEAGEATVSITGMGNYDSATTNTQTFDIAKASQSITIEEIGTKTYGDEPFALVVSGYKSEEVVYEVTSGDAVAIAEDGTVTILGVGDVVITVTALETNNYAEVSGVCSFAIEKASYKTIDEEKQQVIQGNLEEVTFTLGAPYSDFVALYHNSEVVDETCYSVKEGSTIIIFDADYVKGLEVGTYEYTAEFINGNATLILEVEENDADIESGDDDDSTDDSTDENEDSAENAVDTGDHSLCDLSVLMMLSTLVGILILIVRRRRMMES